MNNRWFNNLVMGGNPNIQNGTYINEGKTGGDNRGWQNAGNQPNVQWNKNMFYNIKDTSFPTNSITLSDPKFVDAKLDTTSKPVADFHLGSRSPAINTGLASSSTNITSDHDYSARDSSSDIGAYEFLGGTLTTVSTGGTAGASSTGTGHSASYAFDNNTPTKWLGDNGSQQGGGCSIRSTIM